MMQRVWPRTFAHLGCVAALAGAVGAIALRIVDPVPFIPTVGSGFPNLHLWASSSSA